MNTKQKLTNVFVITVDALRADFLGYMGASINTPNIDILARGGITYQNAIAPGSYTFVSFPSFMTSYYPSEYFIRNGNVDTIADILRSNGYKTVCFNSNPHGKGKLDKGFDYFDDLLNESEFFKPQEQLKRKVAKIVGKKSLIFRFMSKILYSFSSNIALPYVAAEKMNEKAINWLKGYNENKPLFFWMHYMDPHYPYIPKKIPRNISKTELIRLNRACRLYLTNKNNDKKAYLEKKDLEKLKVLYKQEIEYVDEQIGIFINFLRQKNLYYDSLILFFSDHGEMFGEQGKYAHKPYNVYFPQLHIPLILRDPSIGHKWVENPILLSDIPFLILNSLSINNELIVDDKLFHRKRDFLITEGFKFDEIIKNGIIDPEKISYSCIWNNWQLIFNKTDNVNKLFNIKNDPLCLKNIKKKHMKLFFSLEIFPINL
jgi:arylsulfatase A-like enzyme